MYLRCVGVLLQGILKKFLVDKIPLHITALYALQVFAYNNGSPKGTHMFGTICSISVNANREFI